MKIITFNTNRSYTAAGQRIAAAKLSTGVTLMVDVDRGITYGLDCELNSQSVLHAYDSHNGRGYWDDSIADEILTVTKTLEESANSI